MPERSVIVDAGPLVAFLVGDDAHHNWVVEQFRILPTPFLTCEAVLTETAYLVSRIHHGPQKLLEFLEQQLLLIDFMILNEARALKTLISKYEDLPMSLADACLVRMAEIHPTAVMFTLDDHFNIYRKNGRMPIDLVMRKA